MFLVAVSWPLGSAGLAFFSWALDSSELSGVHLGLWCLPSWLVPWLAAGIGGFGVGLQELESNGAPFGRR